MNHQESPDYRARGAGKRVQSKSLATGITTRSNLHISLWQLSASLASMRFHQTLAGIVIACACLLFVRVANAQNKVSERDSLEVRKAIPVAQPQRNAFSNKPTTQPQRDMRPPTPRRDETASRVTEGGADRGEGKGSDLSEGRSSSAPNTMHALNDKRPIGIRDKLSLSIVEDELPARQLVVTDSGEVDVPYIGRVSVENRTCKAFALHLKNLLEKEYYYQATVLIGLDSAGGQVMSKGRYYVDGQVTRGGPYEIPVDETLTISKAIIRAGGFTQYANKKKVRVMRKNVTSNESEVFYCDMVDIMEKGRSKGDIEILPEDKIFVDEKFFNF